jgi:membrane fusion protein (multidrug efflux system)
MEKNLRNNRGTSRRRLFSIALIDPARGTSDVNERLQKAVLAAHVRGATSAFELSPMEIAKIQPAVLVERLRVTGEVRLVQ